MMDFVSLCARVVTLGGVKGMKIAEFDHLTGVADAAELDKVMSDSLGGEWQRFVTERERNGEMNLIYVQPDGHAMRMLIADYEHGELDLVRLEVNADRSKHWFHDPEGSARRHDYGGDGQRRSGVRDREQGAGYRHRGVSPGKRMASSLAPCDTAFGMYKRVVLKLSGEALAAGQGFGVDPVRIHEISGEVAEVHAMGVEVAIVVGGGNFFRGVAEQAREMDRVTADNMGMLGTVINALAIQDALEKRNVFCRVMSAIEMNQVCEPYIRRRAIRHLEKGRVVIFAAGTGNPYFSTDTAASLRAMEIKADVLLKATKVEGIYDADPVITRDAVKFEQITYMEILRLGLTVMDTTAVSLCKDNNLPMIIFNLNQPGNIRRVISGEKVGSLVTA